MNQNATGVSLIASDSKSNTLYTNLTFSCKTETLGSLYSHALLMPLDDPYIVMPLKTLDVFFSKIEVTGICIFFVTSGKNFQFLPFALDIVLNLRMEMKDFKNESKRHTGIMGQVEK